MAALIYPRIDPIAYHIGPLAIRWYGLAYLAAFLFAWWVMAYFNKRWKLGMSGDEMSTVMLAAVTGVVVGGRLGYVLFYNFGYYVAHPAQIPAIWDGGMSFHGGLAGVVLAGWIVSRYVGVSFLRLCDIGAVAAPFGIALGRLANFVNDELWGRIATVPWAMVFPGAGPLPRHPSQLYEAFLEGFLLLGIMWWLSRRMRPDGELLGWMLMLYSVFRIFTEFFRQPDVQVGFLPGGMTMGQLLSVPVLVVGIWLVVRARRGPRVA